MHLDPGPRPQAPQQGSQMDPHGAYQPGPHGGADAGDVACVWRARRTALPAVCVCLGRRRPAGRVPLSTSRALVLPTCSLALTQDIAASHAGAPGFLTHTAALLNLAHQPLHQSSLPGPGSLLHTAAGVQGPAAHVCNWAPSQQTTPALQPLLTAPTPISLSSGCLRVRPSSDTSPAQNPPGPHLKWPQTCLLGPSIHHHPRQGWPTAQL